jgi:hypothetical protein
MAQYTDPTQLSGLFKEAYGDEIINLIPEQMKILKLVPFVESDKEEGNFYNQPVIVQQEHGFTYAAALAGAFALNNSIAMATQNAKVQGSQLALRSTLSYDAAAKASNSKKAFVKATELLVENMMESMTKRLEIMALYGQSASGIGLVASSANASATSTVFTIVLAQYAAGIWAGSVGANLDIYQTNGTTKINSNAVLVISAVNLDNRTVTVTGNSTDITAIDSYIASNPNIAILCFTGCLGSSPADYAGIDKIVTNTGTLFNISAATYADLWKGVSYSAGSAALTFGKVLRGLANAVARGLMEDVTLLVSPLTWSNLNDDLAALRRIPEPSTKGYVQGSESIKYYGQNGSIEVVPHIFLKQGEAYALPHKKMLRPGAQDVSFKTPGRPEELFLHVPDRAGYEIRLYTDQSIFCETPSRMVKFTNIVNS